MTLETPAAADALLEKLAHLPASEMPVLSVYLDTRPNERGRDFFGPFLERELRARAESYPLRSAERRSVEADAERIRRWVRDELPADASAVALFASSESGLFEAAPLAAILPASRIHVGHEPHLYPLARMVDQYRRYAALVADTHLARIFVFGLGHPLEQTTVESEKTRRHKMGGWSQMHYQRHVDEHHQKHAKEAAAALARTVREEAIEHVVVAGDDVILPLIRKELPREVATRIIDVLALSVRAPEHEVLKATLAAFHRHGAADDATAVAHLFDEYRAGGLAVVGLEDVQSALEAGQVDELILSADANALQRAADSEDPPRAQDLSPDESLRRERLAGELVARAHRTGATVRFIENRALLWHVDGAGARLRYRLTPDGPAVPPWEV
jgi:peptide chain release factor subunit 1